MAGNDMSSLDLDLDLEDFDDIDSENLDLDYYDPNWNVSVSPVSDDHAPGRKRNLRELQQNYKVRRPRIVKSDFRRVFPQIWAGVFNSTNYETMRHHISTFYDKDVCLLQHDLQPDEKAQTPFVFNRDPLVGHENLSEFWFRSMNMAPDLVCALKHTYVKVRSDGTSSIKCTFCLTGTRVMTVEGKHGFSEDNKAVHLITEIDSDDRNDDDALDRFIALNASVDAESTHSSNDSLDPMQEVLHRNMKSSDAASRAKTQAKEAKSKGLKRRRRSKNIMSADGVPVEEWLAANDEDIRAEANNNRYLQMSLKAAPLVSDGSVCVNRANDCSPYVCKDWVLDTTSQQGGALLAAPFKFTCLLDINFNAEQRIESLCVNYHVERSEFGCKSEDVDLLTFL